MKIHKKRLILVMLVIFGIIAAVICATARKSSDPVEDFITKNDYPFNGFYNDTASEYSEEKLTNMIQQNEDISKYAQDISIKISDDQTISIRATLKDISELIEQNKDLALYKMWASGLNNQTVSAVITLVSTEDKNTAIKLNKVSIGTLSLDPALVEPLLETSQIQKQLNAIPYNSIYITNGNIAFSKKTPLFLQ